MAEAEMRSEGPPDREEFHKFLIAHTTIAALIYIYISRADGTSRCRDSRALFFLLAFLRERIRARAFFRGAAHPPAVSLRNYPFRRY
jgi:hypothetical protein